MKDIKLIRQVHKTKTGTTLIYTAEYDGEKCYAIVHKESGFITVFDYDKRVWTSMNRFMRGKKYSIAYDREPSGLPRFKLVTAVNGRGSIDLRQFLWARYNKRNLSSLQGRVYLRQDDRADNFCDLRRYNVYIPGESIEGRDDITVQLISNPKDEDKK